MTLYHAKIQSIGELAQDFIDEGILVFFANNAPDELQETALVHGTNEKPPRDIKPGDTVLLDQEEFEVFAVGPVANENLANLGHLVLKFNGLKEAEMRGDVNLSDKPIPQLGIGSTLEIRGE